MVKILETLPTPWAHRGAGAGWGAQRVCMELAREVDRREMGPREADPREPDTRGEHAQRGPTEFGAW